MSSEAPPAFWRALLVGQRRHGALLWILLFAALVLILLHVLS
jgi:hypothetical protein